MTLLACARKTGQSCDGPVHAANPGRPRSKAPRIDLVKGADLEIDDEMLDLAEHIIGKKAGGFDPAAFDDRYESALAELVQAKIEGREITPRKRPEPAKVVNLLDALRESAKASAKASGKRSAQAAARHAPRRKAS